MVAALNFLCKKGRDEEAHNHERGLSIMAQAYSDYELGNEGTQTKTD